MQKASYLGLLLLLTVFAAGAQYAPQAGVPGSDAIGAASPQIVGWATQCYLQRGFMDIANPSLGYASLGDSSLAIGPANLDIVSLGDSGVATLTFSSPIANGAGPDFVVFENGFLDPANDSLAFLELAFVEVSSDGVHFYRFPATSLTQTSVQIGNNDYMNAANLHNLAGKYIGMYGTPFDLAEMAGIEGLNIGRVTHVRLVDVVGSVSGHSGYDSAGRMVNDPYPTPFPSCGFDLDAVGVIHQVANNSVSGLSNNTSISVYPNPFSEQLLISNQDLNNSSKLITLNDMTGRELIRVNAINTLSTINTSQLSAGLYYLNIITENGAQWVEKVTKQ